MRWMLVAFVVVPLTELTLLILIGDWLGLPATVGLTVVTGLAGGWFARREGTRVWRNWTQTLASGQRPEQALTDALLVLVGGLLLVTPGPLTDFVGLACVVPPTRRRIAAEIERQVARRWTTASVPDFRPNSGPWSRDVIQTEGEVVKPGDVPSPPRSQEHSR